MSAPRKLYWMLAEIVVRYLFAVGPHIVVVSSTIVSLFRRQPISEFSRYMFPSYKLHLSHSKARIAEGRLCKV